MNKDITNGAVTVTAAGAVAPTAGLDISGEAGDLTLYVEVSGLSATAGVPRARIVLEDSVNGFTAALPVAQLDFEGPIQPGCSVMQSFRRYQKPSVRAGTASAVIRANVVQLGGTSPSLTLRAWLQS